MQVDTIYYRFENFIDVGTKKFSLGRKYLQIQEPKKKYIYDLDTGTCSKIKFIIEVKTVPCWPKTFFFQVK